MLAQKGLDPDITWKDFAKETESDVSVVTTDVTEDDKVVLNARTAPDCPVAWSVRMSMSIPFVWREVKWNPAWGKYQNGNKVNDKGEGNTFVDGGVLSNFPLSLIADSTADIWAVMGNTDPKGALNLGLLLDESEPKSGAAESDAKDPRLRTIPRVMRLVDAMTSTADSEEIRAHLKEVCKIPVKGYGTTEFRMSEDRLNALIQAGRDAVTHYLRELFPPPAPVAVAVVVPQGSAAPAVAVAVPEGAAQPAVAVAVTEEPAQPAVAVAVAEEPAVQPGLS